MPFKWVKTVISKIQNFENFWDVPISYEFCHLSIFGSNAKIEETKCRHSDRMTAATDNQLNKINCSWCALKNCFFFGFLFHVAQNYFLTYSTVGIIQRVG